MSSGEPGDWLCPNCGPRRNPGGMYPNTTRSICDAQCCGPEQMKEFFSVQGLHLVTASDKAVLDAMASIPDESIDWRGASPGPMWEPARVAERAKRGLPSPEPAEPRECGGVGKCRVCNGQQILRDSAVARARREAAK